MLNRLKNDHHSLNPASISGICALILLAKEDSAKVAGVRTLLGIDASGMVVQSQVKKERNVIFSTLHSLLIQRQDLLEAMGGTDFVLGFMQSVDGEKDPTNLIMIFQASPIYLVWLRLHVF